MIPAKVRRHMIVASGFATILGAGTAFQYWRAALPTPLQACIERCANGGRQGRLVYRGPDSPKIADADRVCECS